MDKSLCNCSYTHKWMLIYCYLFSADRVTKSIGSVFAFAITFVVSFSYNNKVWSITTVGVGETGRQGITIAY